LFGIERLLLLVVMSSFANVLFDALECEGPAGAVNTIRLNVFPFGVDQEPISSATVFVESPDWNSQPVPLLRVESGACFGKLPDGASLSEDTLASVETRIRFCGLLDVACAARSHKLAKLSENERHSGWYVSALAPMRTGVFLNLRLPLSKDGGPIGMMASLALVRKTPKFMLPMGQ
jgi:hypothetical protein